MKPFRLVSRAMKKEEWESREGVSSWWMRVMNTWLREGRFRKSIRDDTVGIVRNSSGRLAARVL